MTDFIKETLKFLSCATNKLDDGHLCQEPIVLSCGHHICKACLQQQMNYKKIKCNLCDKVNSRNLTEKQPTQMFDFLFKSNLNTLFNVIHIKFKRCFQECKNIINDNVSTIENHIQFFKEEIFIKIESMKIELDNLYEQFSNELDDIKETWILEDKNMNLNKIDHKEYELELNKLEENLKNYENMTKDDLFYFENKIKNLQNFVTHYKNTRPLIEFYDPGKTMTKELVGELVFQSDTNLVKNIETMNYEKTKREGEIILIEQISSGKYVMSVVKNNFSHIVLCDGGMMKVIKTINAINNLPFYNQSSTCDRNNAIFFTDDMNHRIIKTDFELNLLTTFGNGNGSASDQLSNPIGICYYNENVFVCDNNNKRVQKFNTNLAFQDSYQVNYKPWFIKNINNISIISASDESSIYFYDLNSFSQLRKYDGHNGIFGVCRTRIYEYYPQNNKLYIYNSNGEILKTLQTNGLGIKQPLKSVYMSFSKTHLHLNYNSFTSQFRISIGI